MVSVSDVFGRLGARGKVPAGNYLMLFHKCGNNYANDFHKRVRNVPYVRDVQIATAQRLNVPRRGEIVDYRCRNFDYSTLQARGLTTRAEARFLVFTRHPASFVLSATEYHLRGGEKWARTVPQPHFDGRTLTDTLRAAPDEAARQIATMTHFGWLFERMTSFVPHFDTPQVMRLKTEELFVSTDPAYYEKIASFLRLDDRPGVLEALKAASPAFKTDLPSHATGNFKHGNPYERLAPAAQAHYMRHWMPFARALGYDWGGNAQT